MIRTTIFALAAAGACYLYAASPTLRVGGLTFKLPIHSQHSALIPPAPPVPPIPPLPPLASEEVSRDIPWQGGESLSFVLGGDVRYTQAPAPRITVVGPRHVVADLEMRGDTLDFRNGARWKIDGLQVDIAAPSVKHFTVAGDQNLILKDYAQDDLAIDVNGSGDVLALGHAHKLAVTVRGSGTVDVSAVAGEEGRFEVIGSGDVRAAPTGLAQVNIVGSGEVDLVREPKQVASNVVGSGGVRRSPVVLRAP